MVLPGIVFSHLLFHRKKTVPVMLLCGLFLLLPAASFLLVRQITILADRPLAALNIELLLQWQAGAKDPASVRTRGLVEPFNLHHFDKEKTSGQLAAVNGVDRFSTALVLWQFDPQNTLTVVGLDPAEPLVGLRKIESLLVKGSFFSSGSAEEALLERHFAKLFGYKPGGIFPLAGRDLTIIGLVDFTEQSNLNNAAVFLPYETALALWGQSKRVVNQIFISLSSSASVQEASREVAGLFPGFSLINRDSLYQNLSAFNRLIYRGGHYLLLLIFPIALLFLIWIMRLHRQEFADQAKILEILGWPARDLRRWRIFDLGFLLTGGLLLAAMLSASVYFFGLPHLHLAPLLDQGFRL